ncbi:helix-turn-helix domain-containing protein [Streptomyces sp. L2]|uniref:PucR family transcriptional regulator n=1 Tax=Streptomyces sp. L2 TaxID=2162665 RepID=UPI0010118D12|nr:helix-turn-helix domain-containing protein [Streptomyces sp. L2]
MKGHLPALGEEIVLAIRQGTPSDTDPAEAAMRQRIRTGVGHALDEFLARLSTRGPRSPNTADLAENCRALGRAQLREGRDLEALHTAYWSAARAAWRRCVRLGTGGHIAPAHMYALAEALFVYIDELASYTVQGYTEEQRRTADESRRRRERLLSLLTAPTPPSHQAATDLARAAGWGPPRTVQVVALRPAPSPAHGVPAPPADLDALADLDEPEPFWLVPDPGPHSRGAIEHAVRGRVAAVGLAVPLTQARKSLCLARRLLALLPAEAAGGTRVVHCSDHLVELLLTGESTLVQALTRRRLGPLQGLRATQRDRLSETLLAWLQSGHSTPETARRLGVHPQTVRYRLRQIQELYGPQLDSPDVQFELELTLRAQQLSKH